MTSRIASIPAKPQSAPAPEATPAELARLATNAKTAEVVMETTLGGLNIAKEALKHAPPAGREAAQKNVDRMQKTYDAAFDRWSAAEGAVKSAVAKLAGPKLAKKTERLYQAYEKTIAARDAQKPGSPAWKQLDAAATRLQQPLEARQDEALMKAKWKPGISQADANLDGLADVASRDRDEQIRLTGAPITSVNADQAAAFDRSKVSRAMKGVFSEYGIQMLAQQFQSVDEAGQLKLLKLLADPKRDHLSKLIENAGKPGAAQFMVDALSAAKGAARTQLLERLTKAVDGPNHELVRRLGVSPTFEKNAEISGQLLQSLKKAGKTDAAEALAGATTDGLRTLRKEFEAKKKVVDKHNAEFARTVAGYAGAVDPKALEAYRDKFVARHKKDFDSYDEVAGRYMEVFKTASSGTFGPLEVNPLSSEGRLRGELSLAATGHAEALLNTQAGQKELDAALKLQLLKQPSWLDSLSAGSGKLKDRIELPGKVADLAAKAMVRVAIGKGVDPGQLTSLVQKNARLLGISGDQAESFAKLMGQVNAPGLNDVERATAYKRAAGELGGGEYVNAKSMKALGLLLAGPGLINGWLDIKNKSVMEVVSHSLDTLGFGNELLSLFSDAKVIGTAGKILGGAGAAISLVKGVAALSEGKLLEGGTSLASAAGGALLLVPGGQLFGAALIIGSAIASAIWGEDPAADAEAAQEKNVREFLVDAGIKPEIAAVLSDVLQTNHRSTGPFIEQMAEYAGVKPAEFLAHLNGKSPAAVREMVNMVKNMPTDKNWNFTKKKTGFDDTTRIEPAGRRNDFVRQGPVSLETAKAWLMSKGLLPPGAR